MFLFLFNQNCRCDSTAYNTFSIHSFLSSRIKQFVFVVCVCVHTYICVCVCLYIPLLITQRERRWLLHSVGCCCIWHMTNQQSVRACMRVCVCEHKHMNSKCVCTLPWLVPRHSLTSTPHPTLFFSPLFSTFSFPYSVSHCGSRSCLQQTAEVEDRRREEDVRGEGRNAFSKSTRGFLEGGGGSKVKESEKRKEKEKQKSRKRER